MNQFTEGEQKAIFRDEKTQKELNAPLRDNTGATEKDKEFLRMLINLVNEGKIDLYKPDSLINHEVYDELAEEKQGKADFEAVNMLSAIRDIKGLHDTGFTDTYQIENLVYRLRVSKERLEEASGNIFII